MEFQLFKKKVRRIMSLREISSRIELNFWQILIGLMSESQSFQKSFRWFYLDFGPAVIVLYQTIDHKRLFRWAVIGLGSGILIGLLISFFDH
jgi:hypothetical protein